MSLIQSPIKVLVPVLPSYDRIVPYLKSIDESHQYSNYGPLVGLAELRMAEYFGVNPEHVVMIDNATNGLVGALRTAEKYSEPWYIPSWTFVATPLAAFQAGIHFKFCDVGVDGRATFPENTVCGIDVLPFGAAPRAYKQFVKLKRLVIDAAASIQNLKDFVFPNFPTAVIVSLHATKMIGAGEGGFVVFNDSDWAKEFRSWSKFGMGPDRIPVLAGTNCKMSEYTAAVALTSFDQMNETIEIWTKLNLKAREISIASSYSFLEPLSAQEPSIYWNVDCESEDRLQQLAQRFELAGIETRKWWPVATHTLDFFFSKGVDDENFSMSLMKAKSTLGLPLHTLLSDHDFARIDKVLNLVS